MYAFSSHTVTTDAAIRWIGMCGVGSIVSVCGMHTHTQTICEIVNTHNVCFMEWPEGKAACSAAVTLMNWILYLKKYISRAYLCLHDWYMLIIASLQITYHRICIMSIKRLKVNYLLCVIGTFAVAHWGETNCEFYMSLAAKYDKWVYCTHCGLKHSASIPSFQEVTWHSICCSLPLYRIGWLSAQKAMEYDRHSLSGYSISHFLEETENCINALFDPIEKPKKAEAQLKKSLCRDLLYM